jgi:hypothetical protein
MRYETEIDLTPMSVETRWEEVFHDYASARIELLKRLREQVPSDGMRIRGDNGSVGV